MEPCIIATGNSACSLSCLTNQAISPLQQHCSYALFTAIRLYVVQFYGGELQQFAVAGSINNADGRRAMVKVLNYKPHSVVLKKHTKIASVIQLQRYSNFGGTMRNRTTWMYPVKSNQLMF